MTVHRDDESPFVTEDDIDVLELAPDPDLAELVKLANAFGLEAPVILTLPGQVIGGNLVSGKKHYDDLADSLEATDDRDESAARSVAKLLRHFRRAYDLYVDMDRPDEIGDEVNHLGRVELLPPVVFIHLADAYIVTPRGPVPISHWRGRLRGIVGWSFGTLSYDSVESDDEQRHLEA